MFYLPLFFVINPILPIHICQLEQHNQCLQLFHPLIYTWSLISWTGWIITEVLKEILHQPGDVSIYYLYAYIFIRIHIYVNNAYQIKFYSLIAIVYIYDILYHNISLYGTKHLNIGDQLPASILDRSSNSVSQVATGSYCVPEMRILLQALHDISWISHVTIGNANNVNISHVYIYVHIYTDCIYEYV